MIAYIPGKNKVLCEIGESRVLIEDVMKKNILDVESHVMTPEDLMKKNTVVDVENYVIIFGGSDEEEYAGRRKSRNDFGGSEEEEYGRRRRSSDRRRGSDEDNYGGYRESREDY
uniref:Uncharacterized protein n=1 Tax=Solanum tuberosum TaxID=4113 RepID=M1APF5_SOLTU